MSLQSEVILLLLNQLQIKSCSSSLSAIWQVHQSQQRWNCRIGWVRIVTIQIFDHILVTKNDCHRCNWHGNEFVFFFFLPATVIMGVLNALPWINSAPLPGLASTKLFQQVCWCCCCCVVVVLVIVFIVVVIVVLVLVMLTYIFRGTPETTQMFGYILLSLNC